MYCYNCGQELPEDSQFCFNCGKEVVSPANENESILPDELNSENSSSGIASPVVAPTVPAVNENGSGTQVDKPKSRRRFLLPIVAACVAVCVVITGITVWAVSRKNNASQSVYSGESDSLDDTVSASMPTSTSDNSTAIQTDAPDTITLDKTYTNTDEGFTFNYPSSWSIFEGNELKDKFGDDNAIVGLKGVRRFIGN